MAEQQLRVEVIFTFKQGRVVFNTKTEKQAEAIVKKINKEGYTSEKPTSGSTFRHTLWYPPQSLKQVEVLTSLKIQ